MIEQLLRRLAHLEQRPPWRMGIVTATAPLSVAVGGAATAYANVGRDASYTPTFGDKVYVSIHNGEAFILGRIA